MPSTPAMNAGRFFLGHLLGCLLIVGIGSASAGEKIKFSDPDDAREMPNKSVREDLISKPLDFLKSRGSEGGSLAPEFPTPSLSPLIPRGKSTDNKWMFDSNGKLDQEAALKQIFKIKDYNLDDWEKKSDSEFESMFGEKTAQNNDPLKPGGFDPRKARGEIGPGNTRNSRMEREATVEEAPNPELDFNRLLESTRDPFTVLPGDSIRTPPLYGSTLNPQGRPSLPNQSAREKERQRELQSQAMEKLLGPRPFSGNPLNDILPGNNEPTRQEINPITGRRIEERVLDSRSKTPEVFGGFVTTPRATASLPLDGLPSRAVGSSVSPSFVPPPTAAPATQNKAPTFEIPRRKF